MSKNKKINLNKEHLTEEEAKHFYNSRPWRKKRIERMTLDNNECQLCKAKGKYSKGKVVHHIKHLKEYPMLALDINNLITLCNRCHEEQHPERLQQYMYKKKKKPLTEERW